MAELPENLQVIKPEGSHLAETEAQPHRLIKERLNFHVKRRLHQSQEHQQEPQHISQIITHPPGTMQRVRETVEIAAAPQQIPQLSNINVNSIENDVTASQTTSKRKEKQQVKTRKPYQRRTDKNTSKTQIPITGTEEGGKSRKNKRQKQSGPLYGNAVDNTAANTVHSSGTAVGLCLSPAVEEGSCGCDETESRDIYMRDKEKCPDILGMVLSAKKRALMQNAEVKEFLGKVMAAFKN